MVRGCEVHNNVVHFTHCTQVDDAIRYTLLREMTRLKFHLKYGIHKKWKKINEKLTRNFNARTSVTQLFEKNDDNVEVIFHNLKKKKIHEPYLGTGNKIKKKGVRFLLRKQREKMLSYTDWECFRKMPRFSSVTYPSHGSHSFRESRANNVEVFFVIFSPSTELPHDLYTTPQYGIRFQVDATHFTTRK